MDLTSFTGSFFDFLALGFTHITDFEGYDHMLFLVALTAVYTLKNWKAVVGLATGFTVGHSITLILGGLSLVPVNTSLIEWLIPVTIAITAIANLIKPVAGRFWLKFAACLGFGLIHGMGFSTFVKMMNGGDGLVSKILAFNIGVEVGQIVIVGVILLITWLIVDQLRMPQKWWSWSISLITIIISSLLIIRNWPF